MNNKIKQKQQTLITSRTLCPFLFKKHNNKVKIASDKTDTVQNNLYFTRKNMGPVRNKARLQLEKKKKNSKVNKLAYFFKDK